jgi:hypothetical protein
VKTSNLTGCYVSVLGAEAMTVFIVKAKRAVKVIAVYSSGYLWRAP